MLTWRVPKGTDKMKNPEEPVPDDAPAIEEPADQPNPMPLDENGSEAQEPSSPTKRQAKALGRVGGCG